MLSILRNFYFRMMNFFRTLPTEQELGAAIASMQERRNAEMSAAPRAVTGACVISIPGVRDVCREGVTSQTCDDVAQEYQRLGAIAHFYPNGHCAKV